MSWQLSRSHYNYFRDYDPGIGRYVESDPIGLLLGGINTCVYTYNNPLKYLDPKGTDVRVYNGSQVSGLHQGISVDTPNGPYQVSFGMNQGGSLGTSQSASSADPAPNGTGNGVVYEDPFPPASVSDVYHTTPAQDQEIFQRLHQLVNHRAPYNVLTNSCRTFSQTQFQNIVDKYEGPWWVRMLNNIFSQGSAAY